MKDRASRADELRRLQVTGGPVVIFNAWDVGCTRAVAEAGASAIGSWSVGATHRFPDGEKMELELAIANLVRIVCVADLPVSVDLEADTARDPTMLRTA